MKLRSILIFSAFLLCTSILPAASLFRSNLAVQEGFQLETGRCLRLGNVFAKNGLWERAVKEWEESMRTCKKPAPHLHNMGVGFEILGEKEKAFDLYSDALKIQKNELYISAVARLSGKEGTGKDMLEYLERTTTRDTAYLLAKHGLWDDALANWKSSLSFTNNEKIYNNLGVAYEVKGDLEKALSFYEKAIRMIPKDSYAISIGRIEKKMRENAQAAAPPPEPEQTEASRAEVVIEESLPLLYVRARAARLRAYPSMKGQIISSIPYGGWVYAIGTNNNWTMVRLEDGTEGWIYSSLLTEVTPPPKAVVKKTSTGVRKPAQRGTVALPSHLYVKAYGANLRQSPSVATDVLDALGRGSEVEVLGAKRGWYLVRTTDGKRGWIYSELLGDEQLPPPETGAAAEVKVEEKLDEKSEIRVEEKTEYIIASRPSPVPVEIYSSPSLSSTPLTSVPNGSRLVVVATHDEWYEIDLDGTKGFIHRNHAVPEKE